MSNEYEHTIRLAVEGLREVLEGLKDVQRSIDALQRKGDIKFGLDKNQTRDLDDSYRKVKLLREEADRLEKSANKASGAWGRLKSYAAGQTRSLGLKASAMAGVFDPVDLLFRGLESTTRAKSGMGRLNILGGAGIKKAFEGISPADLTSMMASYGLSQAQGLGALSQGQAAGARGLGAPGNAEEFLSQAASAAVDLFGDIDMTSEVAKDMASDMNLLSTSMEEAGKYFRGFAADARDANVDTNRFYSTLRSGTEGMSLYSANVGELSSLLGTLNKNVKHEATAGQSFSRLLGGARGMGFEQSAFLGLTETGAVSDIVSKMLQRKDLKPGLRRRLEEDLAGMQSGDIFSAASAVRKMGDVDKLRTVATSVAGKMGKSAGDLKFSDLSGNAARSVISALFGTSGFETDEMLDSFRDLGATGNEGVMKTLSGISEKKAAGVTSSRKNMQDNLQEFSKNTLSISESLNKLAEQLGALASPLDIISRWMATLATSGPREVVLALHDLGMVINEAVLTATGYDMGYGPQKVDTGLRSKAAMYWDATKSSLKDLAGVVGLSGTDSFGLGMGDVLSYFGAGSASAPTSAASSTLTGPPERRISFTGDRDGMAVDAELILKAVPNPSTMTSKDRKKSHIRKVGQ